MPEPDRLESPASDTDRDRRAEHLLIEGLDQYFAGNYDDAIHIWTRVLFLDRTHSRARAYIDRARTALAERQRRTEELLETSYQLLGEGQSGAARNLLDEVVAESGEDERASALRARLDRFEQFERLSKEPARRSSIRESAAQARVAPPASSPVHRRPRATPLMLVLAGLVLVVAGLFGPDLPAWLGLGGSATNLVVNRPAAALPPLSTSDVSLIRARTAMGRGQFAEALEALKRVAPDSPAHAEAETLRIRIQQSLIAGASASARTERRP